MGSQEHLKSGKIIPENVFLEIDVHQRLSGMPDCPRSITALYDVHYTPDDIFMILEFGDAGSLFDHLENHKMPEPGGETGADHRRWKSSVKRWFVDMAKAVQFMHAANVCHKDLSLQNVLIKRTNSDILDVKILDFGLAESFPAHKKICVSSHKVGKANFASPECFNPKRSNYDAKANDCWCLGVMLFMLLTRCAPFRNPLDQQGIRIMKGRKGIEDLLKQWRKDHLVNRVETHLMSLIFDSEARRPTIDQILGHEYCRFEGPSRSHQPSLSSLSQQGKSPRGAYPGMARFREFSAPQLGRRGLPKSSNAPATTGLSEAGGKRSHARRSAGYYNWKNNRAMVTVLH